MTLAQWAEKHGQAVRLHSGGARYVVRDFIISRTAEVELWHLTDYKVSSAGPVIWLVGGGK